MHLSDHALEATGLGVYMPYRRWAVRPKGCTGAMGWSPYAWTVIRVEAWDEEEAVRVALPIATKQRMGIKI